MPSKWERNFVRPLWDWDRLSFAIEVGKIEISGTMSFFVWDWSPDACILDWCENPSSFRDVIEVENCVIVISIDWLEVRFDC